MGVLEGTSLLRRRLNHIWIDAGRLNMCTTSVCVRWFGDRAAALRQVLVAPVAGVRGLAELRQRQHGGYTALSGCICHLRHTQVHASGQLTVSWCMPPAWEQSAD